MAGSRSLGSLTLDLISKVGGFIGPLSQAERELDKKARAMEARSKALQGAITGAFGTIAAGVGGFVAGIASVQAVFEGFKVAIDAADHLDELSARLDISTEKLSTWAYAAQLSGTSLDDLTAALPKLAKNMTEALDSSSKSAEIFKALGVSVVDSAGQLRTVQDVLPEVADRFKALDDSTLEASLAMELFGKSGTGLLEFLNRGGDGIAALEQRARDLGIEIGGDTAAAAAQFKDRLDDLKAAGQGLFTQLSAELLPMLTDFVQWAVDFARDGENARAMVENLRVAVDGLTSLGGSVSSFTQSLDSLFGEITGKAPDASNAIRQLMLDAQGLASIPAGIAAAADATAAKLRGDMDAYERAQSRYREADNKLREAWDGKKNWDGNMGKPNLLGFDPLRQPWRATNPVFNPIVSPNADPKLSAGLYGVLDGKPKGGGSKKSSGKSDAERDAENLKRQVDSLNESMAQQIALYGQTSEVAKVRYELEHGDLTKATQEQKDAILLKAQVLDQMKAETAYMEQQKEIQRDRDGIDQMISDMQFELSLLGLSNEQREREIALRRAGANATDEQRAKIEALSDAMRHAQEVDQMWGDFQRTLGDAIGDLTMDFGNAGNIIKGFFDDIAAQITRFIAQQWAKKLTDSLKNGDSADGSGGWGALIGKALGAVFGGGKASGGSVSAGTLYRVNENRPEMLSVGGQDFLMMGAKGGRIDPNPRLAGGAGQTFNFNFAAPTEMRTQQQMAARVGFESQRAMARNR